MKLSIPFYPNLDKTNSKTGKIPMYMRITLNREKVEMRLTPVCCNLGMTGNNQHLFSIKLQLWG